MDEQLRGIYIGWTLGIVSSLGVGGALAYYQHYLQRKADREERTRVDRRDVIETLKVVTDLNMPFKELREYVTAHIHMLGGEDIVRAWGECVESPDDPEKHRMLYRLLNERFVDVAVEYGKKYVEPNLLPEKPPMPRNAGLGEAYTLISFQSNEAQEELASGKLPTLHSPSRSLPKDEREREGTGGRVSIPPLRRIRRTSWKCLNTFGRGRFVSCPSGVQIPPRRIALSASIGVNRRLEFRYRGKFRLTIPLTNGTIPSRMRL